MSMLPSLFQEQLGSFRNKTLLVTGGTGSFGHKVAAMLAPHFRKTIIFSRDEKKQYEMRYRYPDFDYQIGDVRDYDSVYSAFRGVDCVFHAAALKQVPSTENFPIEALKTNCLGLVNVCKAACARGVYRLVALSTDKAVMPVNAMGMTKALAEKIVTSCELPYEDASYCVVRYGNVLGTRGSVLPLWKRQIDRNEGITITDPSMTRFLMNLEDSLALVVHALCERTSGVTYVWKATALQMQPFAEAVLAYFNKSQLPISIIGRRPGEKLHETLVCEDELHRTKKQGANFYAIYPDRLGVKGDVEAPFTSNLAEAPCPAKLTAMLAKANMDMEDAL